MPTFELGGGVPIGLLEPAQCLLDVCSTLARRLFDVCSMFA